MNEEKQTKIEVVENDWTKLNLDWTCSYQVSGTKSHINQPCITENVASNI